MTTDESGRLPVWIYEATTQIAKHCICSQATISAIIQQHAPKQPASPQSAPAPINTYEQLQIAKARGYPCVAVIVSWGGIRKRYINGMAVYAPGRRLVIDGPGGLSDQKKFSFFGYNGTHHEKLKYATEQAKAWAEKKFGVKGWERNRMRDWVPTPINTEHPLAK